jgi:hypothetical protein
LLVDTFGIKEIKRKSRRRDTESWSGRQIGGGGGNGEREKKDEWSLHQDSEEVRVGILRGVPLTTFQDTDIYANVRIQELKEYESSEKEKVEDESSTVMYNLGVGPCFAYVSASVRPQNNKLLWGPSKFADI